MKITHVRTSSEHFNAATPTDGVVTIITKSWYDSTVFWVSAATAIIGILGVLNHEFPTIAWITTASGLINVILTTYETVIAQGSIVN